MVIWIISHGRGQPAAFPWLAGRFQSATARRIFEFQALANGRVAEYWRRLDVGGFSPFHALGSKPDGNDWFLGPIKDGQPKPVWQALSVALARRTAMLDCWLSSVLPGTELPCPIDVRNDSEDAAMVEVSIDLRSDSKINSSSKPVVLNLPPNGRATMNCR